MRDTYWTRRFIGLKVKYLRKELGLTQIELSRNIGVSQGEVSKIESGIYFPALPVIVTIVELYGYRSPSFMQRILLEDLNSFRAAVAYSKRRYLKERKIAEGVVTRQGKGIYNVLLPDGLNGATNIRIKKAE